MKRTCPFHPPIRYHIPGIPKNRYNQEKSFGTRLRIREIEENLREEAEFIEK
ncbi:hypothetical protein QUF72_15225 [Desulfobacterales bacterium HSG2]|nr:hypothetical protein [Desulfobacterales bacterium HSG2]